MAVVLQLPGTGCLTYTVNPSSGSVLSTTSQTITLTFSADIIGTKYDAPRPLASATLAYWNAADSTGGMEMTRTLFLVPTDGSQTKIAPNAWSRVGLNTLIATFNGLPNNKFFRMWLGPHMSTLASFNIGIELSTANYFITGTPLPEEIQDYAVDSPPDLCIKYETPNETLWQESTTEVSGPESSITESLLTSCDGVVDLDCQKTLNLNISFATWTQTGSFLIDSVIDEEGDTYELDPITVCGAIKIRV